MKPNFVVFIALFSVFTGLGVLNPLLAPMVRELNLSETQGGLIITAAAMMFAVGSPFWGRRSERWGRKTVVLIGMIGFTIGYGLFALMAQLSLVGFLTPIVGFFALVLARALAGFLMGGVPVGAQAYIADTTSGAERTAGIALLGAANGLGFIVGPALGAALVGFGLLAPLYAAVALPLITLGIVAIWLPKLPPRPTSYQQPRLTVTDRRIVPWMLVSFLIVLATMSVQITAGFLFQDRLDLSSQQTAQTVGTAFVITGITNLIAQLGFIRTFRIPPLRLLRTGLPISILGFLALSFVTSLPLLIGAFVIANFGLGLAMPGYTAAATLEVEAHEQGSVAGLMTAAQGYGAMSGPIIATTLYQFSSALPYLGAAVLLSGVAIAVWLHPRFLQIIVRAQQQAAPAAD
jgi:MFS family permease